MTGETKDVLRNVGQHAGLKVMSARWFCTVAAMWVFGYLACTGQLSSEFNGAVIMLIVKSYFDRKNEDG